MKTTRKIAETSTSIPAMEGAGVQLRRAFGFERPERYDPFLMFDDLRAESREQFIKGFPWHPHRGIETISYVLRGDVEHRDSLGNKGTISDGEVQWMTAGSGIIHQEMPKGSPEGTLQGFQLWLNLPAKDKMCAPRYRDISADDIKVISLENGVSIKIICGELGEETGPVKDIAVEAAYLDITVPKDCIYNHPVQKEFTAIAYVIDGAAQFEEGGASLCNRSVLLFTDGDQIRIKTENENVRFLLMTGKPLKEPIAWQGPIVMNTHEELQQAFEEYQNGTFLRHGKNQDGE
jgi:redox-sensitive bicupin YhaK (pirin superfamily)